MPPSVAGFACVLHECRKGRNLGHLLRLHAYMLQSGLEAHASLGNHLISVLVEVGSMCHAQQVFDRLVYRDECSWNSLITGYVKRGEPKHALTLYQKMQEDDSLHPSQYTFLALLKACTALNDLERGCALHGEIARKGLLERDVFVGSMLVNMFAKCGSVAKAQDVFDKLPVRDVVSWTALIAGYAEHGHGEEALNCVDQMQCEGISCNAATLVCSLKACGSVGATEKGRHIHTEIAAKALEKEILVGNALVDLYARCGLLVTAQEVFDKLPVRNVVSWNSLITGYAEHGGGEKALNCFEQMQHEGISQDAVTLVCSLKACGSIGATVKGREIHVEIVRKGFERDLLVGNTLVNMYAKCGLLTTAQEVFDNLPVRDVVSLNALMAGYTDQGCGEEALYCFEQMQHEGIPLNAVTSVCVLKACSSIGATDKGLKIHADIARKGLEREMPIGNTLVDMYAKCGLLADAQEVFDKLPVRHVVSWTALIAGYAEHGHGEEALKCVKQMQHQGISPNTFTLVCGLKACGSIGDTDKGEKLHAEIVRKGLERERLVGNTLVNMYAKCGSLKTAQEVFDNLPVRDVVSWTALIAGYAEHGRGEEALSCFEQMQQDGSSLNAVTFVCSLKACGSIGATVKGQEIHAEIVKKGLERELTVGNALVDMYAKCGLLATAQDVFDKILVRDMVSWNALIAAYAEHGCNEETLYFFKQMQWEGIYLNSITFVYSLKTCSSIGATVKGQETHAEIARKGLERDLHIGRTLVDMYSKCGLLAEAQDVIDMLPVQDVASRNALMAGYVEHECGEEALDCFEQMQYDGISPNAVTFVCSLKACGSIGATDKGQEIHADIARKALEREPLVGSILVDMYAKCGSLAEAQEGFDKLSVRDVVSWTALMAGYAEHGCNEKALLCFAQMQHEGISPDAFTFVSSLKASGSTGATDKGQEIHAEIARKGLERELLVGSTLVDMYAKCGSLAEAQVLFDKLPVRDVVLWNVLIAGYAEHGHGEQTLHCFEQMQREGISPDTVTFVCSLKACGSIGATFKVQEIHAEIARKGFERDLLIGSTLVDVYAKCGFLAEAQDMFDKLPVQDVILWNALITGYAQLGESENVFHIFDRMLGEGVKPDLVTFVSVLNACSHAGLVDKGQMYFGAISNDYGFIPTREHYTCIADLLGRAGHIDKAVVMIRKMPFHPDILVWHTVLGACRKWGNVELGRHAFEHAVRLDEKDAATYVCMSNIYADAAMQEEANKVDAMRVENQAWKKPGHSGWTLELCMCSNALHSSSLISC